MENTEEKKIKDKIFWSGEEISSKFLSQYYSDMLDDIKKENKLLGQFVEDKYILSEEVKKALIAIRKKIEDKNGDSYFLISKTTKDVISFKMRVFKVHDGSLLAANLYLIEVVDNPLFTKPLKTFIAQYVDKNDAEFVNKAKYVFNINVDGEFLELERQENEKIIGPIIFKEQGINEEAVEAITKTFLEELMLELEASGEEGKKIAEEYKKLIEGKSENEKISYTKIKKQIDVLLEKNGGLKKFAESDAKIKSVVEKYNEQISVQKNQAKMIEISIQKPAKEEENVKTEKAAEKPKVAAKGGGKPAAGKAKGGGKSGGGKPKGGGGKKPKKDDKKKDDKKEKVYASDFSLPKETKPAEKNANGTVKKSPQKSENKIEGQKNKVDDLFSTIDDEEKVDIIEENVEKTIMADVDLRTESKIEVDPLIDQKNKKKVKNFDYSLPPIDNIEVKQSENEIVR